MQTQLVTIMTTVETEADAATLADKLIKNNLAACVQEIKIRSHYNWKNETKNDPEILLLVKTSAPRAEEAVAFIKRNHSYDLPEILILPVAGGLEDYIHWVQSETKAIS